MRVTDVHASTTAAFEKFGQGADYLLNGDNAALVHVVQKYLAKSLEWTNSMKYVTVKNKLNYCQK